MRHPIRRKNAPSCQPQIKTSSARRSAQAKSCNNGCGRHSSSWIFVWLASLQGSGGITGLRFSTPCGVGSNANWRRWGKTRTARPKQKTHLPDKSLAVGAWETAFRSLTSYRPQKAHTRRMYNTYRQRRASGSKNSWPLFIAGGCRLVKFFSEFHRLWPPCRLSREGSRLLGAMRGKAHQIMAAGRHRLAAPAFVAAAIPESSRFYCPVIVSRSIK